MKAILQAMPTLSIQLQPDNKVHGRLMQGLLMHIASPILPKDIYEAITALKEDSGFQQALEHNNEYQLNDSAP